MSLIKSLPKKPELTEAVVDISTLSNTELLKYIMDTYHNNYKNMNIKNKSHNSTFYKGIDRGFWECERTINELIGRLENKDNVQSD